MMNEKDALLVIEEMISKTRSDINDNGFYYSFWGWLVFIAAISNYILLNYTDFEVHALPWLVLMPLGGIVTFIWSFKEKKKHPKVKTYVGESIRYVITAFAISMFIVCLAMPAGNQWKAFYPTIMIIYAIWLYASGGLLKFRPLVWGGLLNWATALTAYLWADHSAHLLLIALGVLGGFIIPGYLLRRRSKLHVQGA